MCEFHWPRRHHHPPHHHHHHYVEQDHFCIPYSLPVLFAIIMDPENSKVFIRHDLGCADTYAFMDEQQDESIVMTVSTTLNPADIQRNNNVIMTSKRRRNVVSA